MAEQETSRLGLYGLRVLTLESRRAEQMTKLIENHGGIAVSAPSMREIPLTENTEAFAFADKLFRGELDIVIFMTGVGTRILFNAVETKHSRTGFAARLSRAAVIARGPKPSAVLKEYGVAIAAQVGEPNTWREILRTLEGPEFAPLKGKRIAIQEYGSSNRELIENLQGREATVSPVRVYQWALPEDTGPLRNAVAKIIRGEIDIMLVTSATQVQHLIQIAAQENRADSLIKALQNVLIASIGPVTTQALRDQGIAADLEPVHPKMGQLVHDAAEAAAILLKKKRETNPNPL